MDFVALDVETANPNLASICQIGFADYQNGRLVRSWAWLVNPQDYFDGMNVSIHGINDLAVRNEPAWPDLHSQVSHALQGRVIVSHTAFDRTSLQRVCSKYQLTPLEGPWLDSAKIVRRTWPQYSRSGYGLSNVAKDLGISFRHHDAQEDARAAGEILLRAIQHSGRSLSDWLAETNYPIGSGGSSAPRQDPRLYDVGNDAILRASGKLRIQVANASGTTFQIIRNHRERDAQRRCGRRDVLEVLL